MCCQHTCQRLTPTWPSNDSPFHSFKIICLLEITSQPHTRAHARAHILAPFYIHAGKLTHRRPPISDNTMLLVSTPMHTRAHAGFSFRALLLKRPRMVVHLGRVASGWCEVASLPQPSRGACSVHVCREISPKPDPRGAHLAVPASETGVKTSTYARRFLFFPVSFFPPHVNGDEGGERRYATLPLTPPLSDWKVMGLKETFSQHSPHL